uniref:Si:ch73-379j16.2 n=1 Tax=Xiphophorus maculatus TaxID=8083 RepID=A0A3B5R458_XIPMA
MYSLVTKANLDRETISYYNISITASDCGEPSLSTVKTLIIQVSDVNDNTPVFLQNPLELYLMENNAPGETIFSVSALDNDLNENAVLSYRKDPIFEVNQNNGALYKSLDREQKDKHELVVTAVDGGKPPKSGKLNININVLDINDNRPVFSQEIYQLSIKENIPLGTTVFRMNATDVDEGVNGEIEYNLGKTLLRKVFDIFELDKVKGEIVVKGLVDYEEKNTYELDVEASDKGTPPLTGECRLILKILDVNDNPPEIEVTSLSNTVSEDSKRGTVISLLSFSDKDSGMNGKILANIINDVPFELKPSYKENIYSVVVKDNLDREEVSDYDIQIKITDCGDPPLSTIKSIKIEVSDVNDNSPQFSYNILQIYIAENNVAGGSIFSVSATDNDLNENAAISYSIRRDINENSVASFLNINSENGEIFALKSFDFETLKTFQFQVVATDSGTPSLSSNVTVNVFILDQNDNAPVILYPLSSNGSAEGEVTDHSLFGLDRYTGQIRTLRSFTETDEAEHKLVILVKDNGNVSLSATATVIVKLVEPKEAFAASDVKSIAKDEEEDNVTFYLMITLGAVSIFSELSPLILGLRHSAATSQ